MSDYGFVLVGCGPHGCQAAQLRARIAELEALLAQSHGGHLVTAAAAQRAEARLAAVLAKFEGHHMCRGQCIGCVRHFGGVHYECGLADIRAAATGDPT